MRNDFNIVNHIRGLFFAGLFCGIVPLMICVIYTVGKVFAGY